MNNRYVQLGLLWLGITALLAIVLWLVFSAIKATVPFGMFAVVSGLGSGYIVYKFFASRVL